MDILVFLPPTSGGVGTVAEIILNEEYVISPQYEQTKLNANLAILVSGDV